MDPARNQPDSTERARIAQEPRRPSRLSLPLRRLRSWLSREPEPSIVQVMAEWAEYQLIFNDILTRLSAQLARQAKMEKKRLERISEAVPVEMTPPPPVQNPKQALRSAYAMQRFGGRVQALLNAKEQAHVGIGEGGQNSDG